MSLECEKLQMYCILKFIYSTNAYWVVVSDGSEYLAKESIMRKLQHLLQGGCSSVATGS